MLRKTVFLLAVIFCLQTQTIVAQDNYSHPKNNTPEKVIKYIRSIISNTQAWLRDSHQTPEKTELTILIDQLDSVKLELEKFIILKKTENETRFLHGVLNTYSTHPDSVVNELLIWKYQLQNLQSIHLVANLEQMIKEVQNILKILNSEKDYEDALNLLLSEDKFEVDIKPQATDLIIAIEQLTN
ncbi:MAG: hypothetical protein AAF620_18995 [Bacteroidota bacterium]